ncbi:hypothetical protein V5799_016401 [Amblyomma americanum]|uniref:Beta-galactosidase n=1 Tax=Amblyomma americanum TaxID=6943 RepID=A0AAQ4F587_AMBAM
MVSIWTVTSVIGILLQCCQAADKRSISVDHVNKTFLKDGEPFRYVAGEMHYFRVPKPYWKDRLHKIKMAGLNAVSFYIEWSGHEPEPGEYNFEDMYDLKSFLDEVQAEGLLAVARPGPYICGERDNGGLPYWLLRQNRLMIYRTMDKTFISAVDSWFDKLLPILEPYLYKNGGPIFAVQVENEYGHYDRCDKAYMEHLLTVLEAHLGKDVVYYRTDFTTTKKYECDKVRDIIVAGNFKASPDIEESLNTMKEANPQPAPMVVGEYYTGWMDYWGWKHSTSSADAIVETYTDLMKRGASVTFYMFVGGTNFGFKAAKADSYPLTTSYDYGAPVTESGDIRPIYHAIRDVTLRYMGNEPEGRLPRNKTKLYVGKVVMTDYISLDEVMDHFREKGWLKRRRWTDPVAFEYMKQDGGFLVHTATVPVETDGEGTLYLPNMADRAYVRAGGELFIFYNHVVSGGEVRRSNKIPIKKGDTLTILVENMGREDYGAVNHDFKGLRHVLVNDVRVMNWTSEAVPITSNRDITELMRIIQRTGNGTVPGFFHGRFSLRKGKKVTLYVPATILKAYPEENRVMLFETEGAAENLAIKLVDEPLLDIDIENPSP